MAEVDVNRLREAFGADAGCLPDGIVVNSTEDDWPEVLRALRAAGWTPVWDDHVVVLPDHLGQSAREHETFAINPGAGVHIRFFPTTEVLFDIDLRELHDQTTVDLLCDVVRRVGGHLAKDVLISQEGAWELVVLRYEHAADSFSITEYEEGLVL